MVNEGEGNVTVYKQGIIRIGKLSAIINEKVGRTFFERVFRAKSKFTIIPNPSLPILVPIFNFPI